MVPEPNEREPFEPDPPLVDFQQALSGLSNAELLSALDLVLLELEKRLFRYARVGAEVLEMADEGLVLAVRSRARLAQAQSSAHHAESHLQLVGVGDWKPTSTRPSWNTEPRMSEEDTEPS